MCPCDIRLCSAAKAFGLRPPSIAKHGVFPTGNIERDRAMLEKHRDELRELITATGHDAVIAVGSHVAAARNERQLRRYEINNPYGRAGVCNTCKTSKRGTCDHTWLAKPGSGSVPVPVGHRLLVLKPASDQAAHLGRLLDRIATRDQN